MSEVWETTISEIGEIFDGPHATPTRRETGPIFLNIASLSHGRLDLALSDHVSDLDYEKWTRRVTPREGDLLFSYETRLGEAALMPAGVSACLGRRMGLIRPNRDRVDPTFLLFTYLSPAFQSTIEQNTIHGATVNRIPLNRMGQWTVRLPPLPEQQAIAEVLGALDDKIAANTALATTADDLASTQLSAVLTPRRVRLDDLAQITMGSSPKGETLNEVGEGMPFFQGVRDFGFRHPSRRVFTSTPVRVAMAGDILVSVRAPVGDVNVAAETLCIGRGIAAVRSTIGNQVTLLHQLKRESDAWAPYEAEGTVFGSINRDQLHGIQLRTVRDDMCDAVEAQLTAIEQSVAVALAENRTLAATRDALLPQLMSGKLRVRDAEQIVSGSGS